MTPTELDPSNFTERRLEILRLCAVIMEASAQAITERTTASDVVSAYFTMALTMLCTVKEMGGDLEGCRKPLEAMYAMLPPVEKQTVN